MCCCLFGYDDCNCTPVWLLYIHTCNQTPMATAHEFGLKLILVEYTTHCYVDFGPTEDSRTFICFNAHSNLDVLLLAWLRWSQLHTCVLYIYTYNQTPMATAHDSGFILISVEYRHIVMLTLDQQRAGVRLFVLVYIRIWICCCLFSFDDCNCTPVCHIYIYTCNHTSMVTAYGSGLILISVEYTTHCYVDFTRSALRRTFICFSAHLQPFECVVAWLREMIAIAHLWAKHMYM